MGEFDWIIKNNIDSKDRNSPRGQKDYSTNNKTPFITSV